MKRGGYLILLRDGGDADPALAQRVRASGWRIIVDQPALMVACAGLAVTCPDETTCILGVLHAYDDAPASVEQRLRHICDHGWGAYVAVSCEHGHWQVMRDPSGRMPCLTAQIRGWRVFAAAVADLQRIGLRVAIDWGGFEDLLRAPRLRDGRTALAGVAELLPGQAMTASGARALIWSPSRFVRAALPELQDARAALRQSVLGCVASWGAQSRRILHLLSGGLDSSVVLACLAAAGHGGKVTCLNYSRGAGSELNEAHYAAEIAARAGVAVATRLFTPEAVRLERASAFTGGPRPSGYAFSMENDDFELEAAAAWDADACFSAAGGDGLFYQLRAPVYCADLLLTRGLTSGLAKVAYDSARLTRTSVWQSLAQGFTYAWRKRFDPTASQSNVYLAAGVGASSEGWLDRHPWFADGDFCPGKRLHVWAVLDCLNLFYDYRRAEVAQTVLPLVSQPIIETVLATPSFLLTRGGVDRSLLREAFADVLPASIVQRPGKGAMDGYYYEVLAANAALVRQALLEGVLASRGLLDRQRIVRDLPKGGEPADGGETDVLILYAAEMWARAQ